MSSAPSPVIPSPQTGLPLLAPDFIEQVFQNEIDNIIPSVGYGLMPMVGLGGSAGGIRALQHFFKAMPPDSGMAFVVILHLSPEHDSTLPELLGRVTAMRVTQAQSGDKVEANHVYVIPPGKHLTSIDGHLMLTQLEPERGRRTAVDLFFRSLADTHGPHAAAIVLSGADGDGALGIKRIKERGGLTIAQDPDEAEHQGMPRSAIATGMVDWVLKVAQMPGRLLEYHAREQRLRVPSEDGPHPLQAPKATPDEGEAALREVLAFLRTRTGRDFTYYKRATIVRRIARRLQINGMDDLPAYLEFLRTHPGEAGALLQDLLISVTNFFRDRDSFAALEQLIPELFKGKGPGDCVRVWVPACATGEEAYSLAMLLLEHALTLEAAPSIQIFGCDLDESAIQVARAGVYSDTITADVSEQRLRHFFIKEPRGYHVRREVREVVLFAAHDLLKDAPFSRIDLISCRNLLIYLNRDAQSRALDIFHFALRPHGLLFLGTSESVEDASPLFRVFDKKHRIYHQSPAPRMGLPVPTGPSTLLRALEAQDRSRSGPVVPGRAFLPAASPLAAEVTRRRDDSLSLGELHFRLVEQLAPPSLIVNAEHDIIHLSEHAGRFLQFGSGEPTMNLLRVVHPQLRPQLRTALYKAVETGAPIEVRRVPLELDGLQRAVNLRVAPARELAPGFVLVTFEWTEVEASPQGDGAVLIAPEPESVVRQLERELEVVKGRLRDTTGQYAANTEELKAGNEELQAMNEELRSASEELETSREELQAINEELTTVNQELKSKLEELGHANSDLHNLMASTAIATVFLDRDLRIMRYTPSAAPLFHMIPSDIGRPLADLRHSLEYSQLSADAERVLEQLVPVEREVRVADGHWFLARILPYRTLDDRIAGVVLAFVDITEGKLAREAARESEERLARAIEIETVGVVFFKTDGSFTASNSAFLRMSGYTREDLNAGIVRWDTQTPPEYMPQSLQAMEELLQHGRTSPYEKEFIRKDGTRWWALLSATRLNREEGAEFIIDITARKRSEATLRTSEEQFRRAIEDAPIPVIIQAEDGQVLQVSKTWTTLTGYTQTDLPDLKAWLHQAYGAGGEALRDRVHRLFADASHLEQQEIEILTRSGERRSWLFSASPIGTFFDGRRYVIGTALDITDSIRSRHALEAALQETQQARQQAEAANRTKDHFLATLSHELRTPLTPVLTAAESMLRRKDLPAIVVEGLQMICRNIELENYFINDLLDLTRITRGKLELVCGPLDLHDSVQAAIEVSRADLEEKNQRLTLELHAEKRLVRADALRTQQVFWNLLKNASKFTPVGGELCIRSYNESAGIVIEVADTGMGIDPESLPHIFEAFHQGDTSITRRFGGLGLGLAIARATVAAQGGDITATSAGKGQGATFTVKLPLVKAEA